MREGFIIIPSLNRGTTYLISIYLWVVLYNLSLILLTTKLSVYITFKTSFISLFKNMKAYGKMLTCYPLVLSIASW